MIFITLHPLRLEILDSDLKYLLKGRCIWGNTQNSYFSLYNIPKILHINASITVIITIPKISVKFYWYNIIQKT